MGRAGGKVNADVLIVNDATHMISYVYIIHGSSRDVKLFNRVFLVYT